MYVHDVLLNVSFMSFLKILLYIFLSLTILFAVFLVYFTLIDYRPDKTEALADKESPDVIRRDTLSLVIWNIGYGGLGDDMSFFYDGGERVRTSGERVEQNLQAIIGELAQPEAADFYLLQEVDVASKRSYYTDQFRSIHSALQSYNGYFALNYRVQFVPFPPSDPMGKVTSGLASFSSFIPSRVIRHDMPGGYAWPKRLFMLDRCFMSLRFPVEGAGELVVVNTHNSAYDRGKLKKQEMEHLRAFMVAEYEKGNYVIAGGDWNQFPPGIHEHQEVLGALDSTQTTTIAADFMPDGWQWVYDPATPTNRSLDAPYNANTQKTLIDFYLTSPNITPLEVKTKEMNFHHSDHQPVWARLRLQ